MIIHLGTLYRTKLQGVKVSSLVFVIITEAGCQIAKIEPGTKTLVMRAMITVKLYRILRGNFPINNREY